jgi:large subunit ribosomal protein L5e
MGYVKVLKSSAYHKRFQVKFRRRREGKTDYQARRRLVVQDKNKYNSPRYRLVVRVSNKKVVCQIVHAKMIGDFTICQATSHELPRYGCKVGLTNYAACYATGLLCARRLLKKLDMDGDYEGQTEVDGEMYTVEQEGEKRPFTCLLDVGLVRTTTGAKVFGALKGAADGGLNIPHSEKRFPGYDREGKDFDAETHKKYIFAGHVTEYMELLEEEDPDRYQMQFAKYIEEDIEGEGLEEMWTKVHEAIRENPDHVSPDSAEYKNPNPQPKRTLEERKAAVQAKKSAMKAAMEVTAAASNPGPSPAPPPRPHPTACIPPCRSSSHHRSPLGIGETWACEALWLISCAPRLALEPRRLPRD